MNPWVNIWIHPRATIREIVETNISQYVIPLAMVAGIFNVIDNTSQNGTAQDTGFIFLAIMILVFGPLGGIVSLYISGGLLKWSGGLLGGTAESDEVRAAISWSSLIRSTAIVLLIPQLLLFGREMFTRDTPNMDAQIEANPLYALIVTGVFIAVILAAIVLTIWYVIVFLKCLGEVHQFSAWKALGATIIGYGVIIVPLAAIILLLAIGLSGLP